MEVTFTSAEEAKKFRDMINEWRSKVLKTILVIIWIGFSAISLFALANYCKESAGAVPLWIVIGIASIFIALIVFLVALVAYIWSPND